MTLALLNDSESLILLLFPVGLRRLIAISFIVGDSLLSDGHLNLLGLRLQHDLTLDVVVAIGLDTNNKLVVVFGDLVLYLGAAKKKVLLHVLQRFKTQVHIDRWDTLTSVLLGSEDQILFDFKLVDGLSSHFSSFVFDEFSVDVKSDAEQFRVNLTYIFDNILESLFDRVIKIIFTLL